MLLNEDFTKELEKMKTAPGFKLKEIAIPTGNGPLNISLHGPDIFLTNMPRLIEIVAIAGYNRRMFAAISKANKQIGKPIACMYTMNRAELGAGRLYKVRPWYKMLSPGEVSQLMLQFNSQGYNEKIQFECRKENGKRILSKEFDDVKYTLAHEFFHLWYYVEPRGVPRQGILPISMRSVDLQPEVWATRYTNGWRYQEKRCVRTIYRMRGVDHDVDNINNYK